MGAKPKAAPKPVPLTMGRVVLVNIGLAGGDELLRPGIVVDVGEGWQATVNVQVAQDDFGVSGVSAHESNIGVARRLCEPGDGVGCWRWPPKA